MKPYKPFTAVGAFAALLGMTASALAAPYTGHYPTALFENTTGYAAAIFLGAPDDTFLGIGGRVVTYDFGSTWIKNLAGQNDFNIYEVDYGAVEFSLMSVSVSQDGVTFVNVDATMAVALNLTGDEAHGDANFRKSFGLPAGWTGARYVRIDGDGTGAAGGTTGFDLDAMGAAELLSTPDGGSSLAMFTTGMLALWGMRRRRS